MVGFLNYYLLYLVNMFLRIVDMFFLMVVLFYGKSEDLNFIFRYERIYVWYVVRVVIV